MMIHLSLSTNCSMKCRIAHTHRGEVHYRQALFDGHRSVPLLVAAIASSQTNSTVLDRKFSRLKDWVHENGGFVHDALRLQKSEKPPYLSLRTVCGVEGKDILDPCITVPSSVVVDRRKALNNLEDIIASAGCPPLYGRPTVEILALFIAYHKKQGEMSMWYPAIESLPEIPACPWLKQIRDLKEIEYDEELQETVRQERSGNNLIAQQLHTLYGQFLQLSIKDLLWAFAQVQCSTFHQKDGSFWAPLVHFIQHDRTQPPLYIYEEGRFVTWGWQDRLVSPGEHLRMDIGIRNPLLLYLSRGIVSSDL